MWIRSGQQNRQLKIPLSFWKRSSFAELRFEPSTTSHGVQLSPVDLDPADAGLSLCIQGASNLIKRCPNCNKAQAQIGRNSKPAV